MIGQTRRAEEIARNAFDDERQAERQQQTVEMIELVEPLQAKPLDDDAGCADDQRRDDQGGPVADAGILQQQVSGEGAHHVLGAMREIDDVEHAEDDGEAEAQQRIERAVDQSDQQLPEQCLRRDAEKFEHANRSPLASTPPRIAERGKPDADQPFTSGQSPSLSGRNASAAGMVAA